MMKKPKRLRRIKPRNPLVSIMRLTRKPGPFRKTRKYPDWNDWEREERESADGHSASSRNSPFGAWAPNIPGGVGIHLYGGDCFAALAKTSPFVIARSEIPRSAGKQSLNLSVISDWLSDGISKTSPHRRRYANI